MKRSAALAQLSRDHHLALEAALRLRRATAADLDFAITRFVAFWQHDGARHFEIEEAIVLPARPAGDADWDAMAARVRAEHAEIIARAQAVGDADVNAARGLGELLEGHVRFEERVVFGMLERALDEAALAALGAAVEAAHRRR